MRFTALVLLPLTAMAFAPRPQTTKVQTKLDMTKRRDVLATGAGIVFALTRPKAAAAGTANPFLEEEVNFEPSQMPSGDKIDINGAFVTDYKALPGFYPHAAGKIASNGPFEKVSDIYKIKGLTKNDIKVFKKYEKELAVLPPGRMFDERLNQRQST